MTTPEELDALQAELRKEHEALLFNVLGTDEACAFLYAEDGKPVRRVGEIATPASRADAAITALRARVAELEAELHTMRTAGIIEVAVRNPSVMDYMKHWDARAEAAEVELAKLSDPVAVHANMLRGTIAKPSVENILHLYPELARRGQGAQVKPLVWPDFREGGTCGHPHHFQYFVTQDHHGVFWAHFDMSQHGTLEAAQQHCEQHYQRAALVSPGDGWRSMDSAPKDGRLLCLLVDYSTGSGPLEDAMIAATIGFNNLSDTGEDEWQFAGWNWSHDCFSEGHGVVIGWTDFICPAPPASEGA